MTDKWFAKPASELVGLPDCDVLEAIVLAVRTYR